MTALLQSFIFVCCIPGMKPRLARVMLLLRLVLICDSGLPRATGYWCNFSQSHNFTSAQYGFTPVECAVQCSTYHFSHNIGKLVKLYRPAAVGVELGNNLTNLRLAALQPEKLENVEQLCNNSLFLFLIKRKIVLISTTKSKMKKL